MDRMRACGVCDPGSIPGEGTKFKADARSALRLNVGVDRT